MAKGADSIVVLGDGSVEEVRRTMDEGNVISGNPILHTVQNYFEDSDRQLTAGVWESTAGKWHAFRRFH